MNKTQADRAAYMTRTANHSTKPSRRGVIDVDHGMDLVTDRNPVDVREDLKREKFALQEEVRDLNDRMKVRRSKDDYQRLKRERDAIGRRLNQIDSALKALNDKLDGARRAVARSYPTVFLEVARHMLPPHVFDALHGHTTQACAVINDVEQEELRQAQAMQVALQNLPGHEKKARMLQNRREKAS